ncbi:MAG: hypothetical protein ABJG68_11320 [Crocinitomicaceae bacterium]
MKIEYFKKLGKGNHLRFHGGPKMVEYLPKGCSIEQINELQKLAPGYFPKAYKEYLFLAGEHHYLYDSGIGFCMAELPDIQEEAKELLSEDGYEIDGPFWVIDILYNDQFHFFYLDGNDNPAIYHWIGSDEEHFSGYTNGIKKVSNRLNRYIEEKIPSKAENFIYKIINRK